MPASSGCVLKLRETGLAGNLTGGRCESNLSSLLQDCIRRLDVQLGRQIHDHLVKESSERQGSFECLLIRLYAASGCLTEANCVFGKISEPNLSAWAAIIHANAKFGQSPHAIELYFKAQETCSSIDSYILVAALKACAEDIQLIREGKLLHQHVVELNEDLDAYVTSSLIEFYARGGALDDAFSVFNRLTRPDKVTWGIMIGACTEHGHGQQALALYRQMKERGMDLDKVIFLCALKACCIVLDIEQLRIIHIYLVFYGLQDDNSLGNALLTAYAKWGCLEEAQNVFKSLPARNVITWGSMIEGFVQHGYIKAAFQLYQDMQKGTIDPDHVVILSFLKACSYSSSLFFGRLMHAYILMSNFDINLQVCCSLIDMYSKCSSLNDAFTTFQRLPGYSIVALNTMISAYLLHGFTEDATRLIQQMLWKDFFPNELTILCLLKLCSATVDLYLGRMVHTYIVEWSHALSEVIMNTLIDMYVKCGSMNDGHHVFDRSLKQDVVSWAVIISGFVQEDRFEEGCKFFWQLLGEGLQADETSFISGLQACTGAGDLGLGRLIHAQVVTAKVECETSIGNSLIDLYGKCGSFNDTYAVFSDLTKRDKVSYNTMIASCAQYSESQKSLQIFDEMIEGGMLPTQITLACTISACTDLVALGSGKLIHHLFIEMCLENDEYIINALAGMYFECGSAESALKVVKDSSLKDIVLWNTIIAGFAQHGLFKEAHSCYEQMCKSGIKPDGVTFLSLLSVCSHAGLVDEGRQLIKFMKRDHGLTFNADHHSCMVDLLGRTGCVKEAVDLIDCIPYKASVEGLTAVLSHCKEKGLLELGNSCCNELIGLKDCVSAY